MHNQLWISTAALVGITLFGNAQAHAGEPSFMGLGSLGSDSYAQDVSGNGMVVVGDQPAWRWSLADGMIPLGSGTFQSVGVSVDGTTIVGNGSSNEAFRWTSSGGVSYLGTLPGGSASYAQGVSGNGQVVAGQGDSSTGTQGWKWTPDSGMLSLGTAPGFTESYAKEVSSDGSVIVGYLGPTYTPGQSEAARWENGGVTGLGYLPGGTSYSHAYGISADGSVIVGVSESALGSEAFRWTVEDGMVGLGFLPGGDFNSIARDASADGSVIIGDANNGVTHSVFIWDNSNGMRELRDVLVNDFALDLTGWLLQEGTGVSDDGRTFIGWGFNPSGSAEAWIATIPEPATLHLLGLGGFVVTRRWLRN